LKAADLEEGESTGDSMVGEVRRQNASILTGSHDSCDDEVGDFVTSALYEAEKFLRQSRAMLEPPSATPLRQSVIRQYPPTVEATDESLSEDGDNLIATERKLTFSKSLRRLQTIAEPELPSSATASPLSTATSTCVEEDIGRK
jgi:hypothetical protein